MALPTARHHRGGGRGRSRSRGAAALAETGIWRRRYRHSPTKEILSFNDLEPSLSQNDITLSLRYICVAFTLGLPFI